MRTTIDIDDPKLREPEQRSAKEGKSLGRLVSEILAGAPEEDPRSCVTPPPAWIARPMRARVNLSDREAVHRVLAP